MLVHYTILSLRRIWRQRQVNLIRVSSLALGLASGLVIFLFVNYMFSFDRHHPHMERSYWVVTDIIRENTMQTDAAPRPLAEVLRRDYPFVESATRLETVFGRTIGVPDGKNGWAKKFNEARNVCFAEPQYFNHFLVKWISGNPKTALSSPNTIVLSERYARKYFDRADPVGRTLRLDNRVDLTVTGIIENPPANTQLRYDALISYTTIPDLEQSGAMQDWEGLQSMCFVLLREGSNPGQLAGTLDEIRKKNLSAEKAARFAYHMLPLPELNHERSGMAPRPVLYALIAVGLLLVLAACINYINLATAQALQRAREVGVRKVVGSNQFQLIRQFLFETAILTFFACAMSLVLTQMAMPLVNRTLAEQVDMLHPAISVLDLLHPESLKWFLILIAGIVILAGLYPAWVLSRFNPAKALAGQLTTQTVGGFNIRRTLITGQFVLSQLFLIIVLVITAQLRHMQKVDWGFSHERKLTVWLSPPNPVPYDQLRQSWLQLPGVESVTYGSDPPASPYNRPAPFSYHIASKPEPFETRLRAADEHYIAAFGLSVIEGRNFRPADTTAQEVLVNETLVRQLGVSPASSIVGKRMRIMDKDRMIVGVVKDFRSGDLHQSVLPVTLVNDLGHTTMAVLTLSPNFPKTTLKAIEQVWDETLPDRVYKADHLDDLLGSFLDMERLLAGFVQAFALIAMAMSCIGLYGLVTFMAEGRAKEIGVRRVLGARTQQLLWIFGREFGRLILIGFLVAAPLGWWLTGSWLQQYVHRITSSAWLIAATLGLTVLITLLTVLGHALKAAVESPVKYLRAQ
ncbi:FtsX-like permease family protein [Dyadobacter flavalbus]|uniref:FtsX-like permease family protein n=1 Tax=Dyadobacter flavalbus TaxID=2579942 RepID=A0A5M8QC21_9BACT|nr:ABC transporter permease [Dyadobacter flavalbus]KAA6432698.1 FtsX-like permease family protein [Dyadobacter flavalbus]